MSIRERGVHLVYRTATGSRRLRLLLTHGPYAYMRNPMLSGVFLILFGAGIFLQSVFLIFVFTPLFIALNVIEVKMIEEPELALRLGKEYLVYKKRTPMFFPEWIRKRKGKP